MQIDYDKLKVENANILAAYREKSRKHQATQDLYDRLKRKEMTAVTRSAAFDSAEEVLQSVSSRQGAGGLGQDGQYLGADALIDQFPLGQTTGDITRNHQSDGGGGSREASRMMPPPLQRPVLDHQPPRPSKIYPNVRFRKILMQR